MVFFGGGLLWLCLLFTGCNRGEPEMALAASLPPPTPTVIQNTPTPQPATVVPSLVKTPTITTASDSCPTRTLVDKKEIVIGVLVPVFGDNMLTGQSMQAGFNIAVRAINKAGGVAGKPVRISVHDTMASPDLGANGAEHLIVEDCAVALIGTHKTDIALAVKEVAHQHGIPLIVLDAYGDTVTENRYPEIFRISPSTTQYFQQAAAWVSAVGDYNADGSLVTVVVAENTEHGRVHADFQQHSLAAENIQSKAIYVDLPMEDFSPVIARIVEMEQIPDIIFIRLAGEDGLRLQKQLLDNGLTPQNKTLLVVPQAALDSKNYWQLMGENGALAIVPRVGAWPNTVGEMGTVLAAEYNVHFNKWPDNYVFSAHDAIYLIADAIERSHSVDGRDLILALEQTDIELAAGHYSFPIGSAQLPAATSSGTVISSTVNTSTDWRWHQWLDAPVLYLQYTLPYQDSTQMAVLWPLAYKTIDDVIVRP